MLVACGRMNFNPVGDAATGGGPGGDADVSAICFRELVVGDRLTCARSADSSVWCAGWNSLGQIGIGTVDPVRVTTPTPVLDAIGGEAMAGATQLAMASYATCARKSDGSAWCWGSNAQGQIGDGTGTHRLSPVETLPAGSVSSVAAGARHMCAVRMDDSVWCWGENLRGQLGDGTTMNRDAPVMVASLADVAWVEGGRFHTCARKLDGALVCWGSNTLGQLGDGTNIDPMMPVNVRWTPGGTIVSDIEQVALGREHTCGLRGDGTVWCWGAIQSARTRGTQNVEGLHSYGASPLEVMPGATQIASGHGHTCALVNNGSVWCWGSNSHGQLGDGSLTDRVAPAQVTTATLSGLTDVVEIAAGGRSTCARRADHTIWCWGWNTEGQLGNGTRDDAPRAVLTQFTCP